MKYKKDKYSIKIPKQKHKTKYTLRIMDKNKNVLVSKSLIVYRTDYVKIGMTKAQAKQSTWGSPTKINTYTSSSWTTEKWVYRWTKNSTSYLYFRKGKLSSIQN